MRSTTPASAGSNAQDRELRIDRTYLSESLRLRAQELATKELGPQTERTALTDQRPKVMPHPALIARYVEDLLTTFDTDVPKARAILMRVLRPFTLTPDRDSYRISGALNLSAVVGPGVSEKLSSGGVI